MIKSFIKHNWLQQVSTSALLLLVACMAVAHDARPVTVRIHETLPGIFQYSVTPPPDLSADNVPTLVWPENCFTSNIEGTDSRSGQIVQCPEGLSGITLSLAYPLYNPSLATFYSLTREDDSVTTAMLPPSAADWLVPEIKGRFALMKEYLRLGLEHILGGFDHLLFVFGLLVISRTFKRVLLTISGFTLAHSISLSLAALGLVTVPIRPVEATIALSIVFLAYEISRHQINSLTYRKPLIVSFGFGLLHGLGFASALGEIGLAKGEVLVSLLFFNLGVEIGQVFFISVVMLLIWLIYRSSRLQAGTVRTSLVVARADIFAAYLIGIPAMYWMLQRVSLFL